MLIDHPYVGMTWSYTNGAIIAVDQNGPAAGQFQVGGRIITIDQIPVFEARNLPNRHAGDWVSFTVEQQGLLSTITIQLVRPTFIELSKRLSIIPIAVAFWLLGTIVLAFGHSDRLIHLFFFFCQTTSLILGLGSISSYAPLWSWWIFALLVCWIGPLTFHTHLALSYGESIPSTRKIVLGLYLLAFFFSIVDFYRLRLIIAGPLLTFKYIYVSICILASASLLISASFWGSSSEQRRRTKIAGISAATAFMPFVFFSLIPDAITGQFTVPYEITFLALLILPLGYSYSISLYRLVKTEREISQSAAYALATFIIFIFYAFLYIFITSSFSLKSKSYSFVEIGAVIILVLSAHPVHQALYRRFNLIFFGGWVDDNGAVKHISQDLKHVTGDTYSIAQTLCQTLQRTMLLDYVNLLLSDGRLIKTAKDNKITSEVLWTDTQVVTRLFYSLQEKTGRELGSGEELNDFLSASGIENWPLLGPRPQIWLLFGGRSNWQGLLVLGSKRGRGDFGTKDLEILEVVLRQAGAALENERLLEEVRQRSNQVKELNRKARWALEVERKRIARNLHDIVIQTLVGINFQLANIRARNDPDTLDELENIRNDLHESLVELRGICADLRPPALDALGLMRALEARITEIKSQVSFEIYLNSADLSGYEIRDEVSLCVYRFLQEALLNIQKHSEASMAVIDLQVDPEDWLQLSIEDDGQGFDPPETLEVLVAQQHFGLIGLQEQVEAVGGKMEIESETGKGCHLSAWIPLKPGHASSELDPIKFEQEMEK